MDLDISSHGFSRSDYGEVDRFTKKIDRKDGEKVSKGKRASRIKTSGDRLIRGKRRGKKAEKGQHSARNPVIKQAKESGKNFRAKISDTIKDNNLPKAEDLSKKISEETKNRLQDVREKMIDQDHFDSEMKSFFNLLSKLYPLSLTLLDEIFKAEDKNFSEKFTKEAFKLLSDLGKLLGKQLDALDLPKGIKEQLKGLAEKLSTAKSSLDSKDLTADIDKLLKALQDTKLSTDQTKLLEASLKKLTETLSSTTEMVSTDTEPEIFQTLKELGVLPKEMVGKEKIPVKDLQQLIRNLQNRVADGRGSQDSMPLAKDISKLLESMSNTLQLTSKLTNATQENKLFTFSSLAAMTNFGTNKSFDGLLGPQLKEMSDNLGDFITNLKAKPGIFSREMASDGTEAKLSSNAFNQAILAGAVLGKIIAGRGREALADENVALAIAKMESAKDLKIIDQVSINLLAFFPDLSSDGEDSSDVAKAAKQSLMRLIRLLLQLVLIISALGGAAKKLGQEGMENMLEQNAGYITHLLDELSFAYRKVDEHYLVNISVHLAHAQEAKNALAKKDYENFWPHIFGMFTAETELTALLKEFEDAQPLFDTVEELLTEADEELPFFLQS